MLFLCKKLVCVICLLVVAFTAWANNTPSPLPSLSVKKVEAIIKKSHFNPEFQILAKPEVVKEVNTIRRVKYRRLAMQAALQRMKQYNAILQAAIKQYKVPKELLAIPIIESSYQPSRRRATGQHPAGMWQMVAGTGRRFGLVINAKRDDRLNVKLSTAAAFKYLKVMHNQFNNWMLSVLAYQYGEQKIHWLVRKMGTKNVWVLANSRYAPRNFKRMISLFDADVIVMSNPSLLSS